MSTRIEKHRTPLFTISKRNDLSLWKRLLIRGIMLTLALLVSLIISLIIIKKPVGELLSALFEGAFLMPDKLFLDACLLLGFGIAVVPAFKMRYWNMGANGQVLAGALVAVVLMFYMGNWASKSGVNNTILIVMMLVGSVLASVIWAVIPAIFKALFGTNETLFTLMMNYVATFLVAFFLEVWVTNGSGALPKMKTGKLPTIGGNDYLLIILIVLFLAIALFIYLNFTKHGYEISVVGESERTARYVGISVRKVIIRTMILSGLLCGLTGYLIGAGLDQSITTNSVGGQGFTAIMVSWLAKFNPLVMILTAGLIQLLSQGAAQISQDFNVSGALPSVITGIILFFIIGCEFFINYELHFRGHAHHSKVEKEGVK